VQLETQGVVGMDWGKSLMAVRTAEIDVQALGVIASLPEVRQVVILGAGLDPRAWRLPWPAGTHVFEVDSGSVEAVKLLVLGLMPMAAASREFVQADLAGGAGGLVAGLCNAGEARNVLGPV
jgi:methyltransferase (TIGR00027 family)